MYFDNFEQLYYDFETSPGNFDLMVLRDITKNVRFRKEIVENVAQWEYYYIKDGETMEMISERLYGSPLYHWVLMILNEKYDYINDMPLTQSQLEKHVIEKYGQANINAVHHYEDVAGLIVNYGVNTTTISNTLHEDRVNEQKRKLKILAPALLFDVLRMYRTL